MLKDAPEANEFETALRAANTFPSITLSEGAGQRERQAALAKYQRDLVSWRRRDSEITQTMKAR